MLASVSRPKITRRVLGDGCGGAELYHLNPDASRHWRSPQLRRQAGTPAKLLRCRCPRNMSPAGVECHEYFLIFISYILINICFPGIWPNVMGQLVDVQIVDPAPGQANWTPRSGRSPASTRHADDLDTCTKGAEESTLWTGGGHRPSRVAAEKRQHRPRSGSFHVGEQSAQRTCCF